MPKVMFPVVDVREVAQAHLQAIKVPEARNKRINCTARTLKFKDMSQILKNKFYPAYPLKTNDLCYC